MVLVLNGSVEEEMTGSAREDNVQVGEGALEGGIKDEKVEGR